MISYREYKEKALKNPLVKAEYEALVKSDAEKEKEIINQLIEGDPELKRQHELFKAEMEEKQKVIDASKKNI